VFADIAIDLGLTADQVRSAFSNVGHSGMTILVTEEDRVALARYKVQIMMTALVDITTACWGRWSAEAIETEREN
jgi:hypothetical protein